MILVWAEGGELGREALAFGRRLGEVQAVALEGEPYAPAAWAAALAGLIEERSPEAVVAPGSDRGQEVLAHVAARLELPFAANVVSVEPGSPLRLVRQRWGGSLLEEATLDAPVRLLTVAPHAVAAAGDEEVETVAVTAAGDDARARVVRREEPEAGTISLGEARIVVGGGRGVGSAGGFTVLQELAEALDGAVGGSRVVTNLGWRPHADQIGQTGLRIAPELYIACGISGAIQHWVGCKGAKAILAINTDPSAPIVQRADYAVIGDLHEVVPAIVAELKQVAQSN